MVLGGTTNFCGSIQQGTLQFWPSWLNSSCSISISISARGGDNCSCSSDRFDLEGWLEQASSSWVPELFRLRYRVRTCVSSHGRCEWRRHYHVMLFDAFFLRDGFHIADCTAETLGLKYVVNLGWVTTGAVYDRVWVSLLEPGVASAETIDYGEKSFKDQRKCFILLSEMVYPKFISGNKIPCRYYCHRAVLYCFHIAQIQTYCCHDNETLSSSLTLLWEESTTHQWFFLAKGHFWGTLMFSFLLSWTRC